MTPSTETAAEKTWAEILVAEYKDGASDVEVCDALGISKATFDRKYKEDPLFKELVDIGRLASTAWWYRWGRKNLLNKSANTSLWAFNMKNRYGWAEKSESQTTSTVPAEQKTLEELQAEVVAKLPGLLKRHGVQLREAQVLDMSAVRETKGE